jgi:Cu(I)/Ag(I) efflux system membrane fusion protein
MHKRHLKVLFLIAFAIALGVFVGRFWTISQPDKLSSKSMVAKKPLYWIDSMEPTIRYSQPGKSRMGMETVPVYAEGEEPNLGGYPIIKIDPAIVENLGVRIAAVEEVPLYRQIHTVGYVQVDENKIINIFTLIDGWVRKLFVKRTDEFVSKGQLLLQLYSPTLVNAQEEYLIAMHSGNNDLIRASHRRLLALGISEKQIEQLRQAQKTSLLVAIYAPQSGIISPLNIREGARVTPETNMMGIVDLSSIWILVEVYASQASWVRIGQLVEAKMTGLPDRTWQGHVEYVYPQVDPTTRTLKVRLRFDNTDYFLKPNMYASVTVFVTPKLNVLSIPLEAVISTGTGHRVIVALGQGRFQPRPIVTGIESGDRIEVISGLKKGEQVVTSAQFLIDSESNLKASLERLSEPSSKPAQTQQHGM